MKFFLARLCLTILCFSSVSVNAAILNVVGGKLAGASGVDVLGVQYDVAFLDGSCVSLFNGCIDNQFTFVTHASAQTAAEALFAQVFIDGAAGLFDSNPGLTNGCDNTALCDVLTPYHAASGGVFVYTAFNGNGNSNHANAQFVGQTTADFTNDDAVVYARWTLASPAAVPEPASLALLVAGALALTAFRRPAPC